MCGEGREPGTRGLNLPGQVVIEVASLGAMLEGKHSWGEMHWALSREMQIEGAMEITQTPKSQQPETDGWGSLSLTSSCLRQIVAGDI